MMSVAVQGLLLLLPFWQSFVPGEAGSCLKVITVVGSHRVVANRISATGGAPGGKLIQCESCIVGSRTERGGCLFVSGRNQVPQSSSKYDLDSKDCNYVLERLIQRCLYLLTTVVSISNPIWLLSGFL